MFGTNSGSGADAAVEPRQRPGEPLAHLGDHARARS
jgi:hypothetical protein